MGLMVKNDAQWRHHAEFGLNIREAIVTYFTLPAKFILLLVDLRR